MEESNEESDLWLFSGLTSDSERKIYDRLVIIRTRYTFEKNGFKKFRTNDGVKLLLPILARHSEKLTALALSILGNCCMDSETRIEVRRRGGIKILVDILANTKNESIANRACRTIANLAQDEKSAKLLLDEEESVVAIIVRKLTDSKDEGFQQSAIRCLRRLGEKRSDKLKVIKGGAVKAVASFLTSENDGIVSASMRALGHFLHGGHQFSTLSAQQVLESGNLSVLLDLCKGETSSVQQHAAAALLKLTRCTSVRPALCTAGALDYFIEQVDSRKEEVFVYALCLCGKDSVTRVKMREGKGLQLLLGLLHNPALESMHKLVMDGLSCFIYDEKSLDVMLRNNFVDYLIDVLNSAVRNSRADRGTTQQNDSLGFDTSHLEEPDVINRNLECEISDSANQRTVEYESKRCQSKNNKTIANEGTITENVEVDDGKEEHGVTDKDDTNLSEQAKSCSNIRKSPVFRIDSPTYQESCRQREAENLERSPLCFVDSVWSPNSSVWYSPDRSPDESSLSPFSPRSYSSPSLCALSPGGSSLYSPVASPGELSPAYSNEMLPFVWSPPVSPGSISNHSNEALHWSPVHEVNASENDDDDADQEYLSNHSTSADNDQGQIAKRRKLSVSETPKLETASKTAVNKFDSNARSKIQERVPTHESSTANIEVLEFQTVNSDTNDGTLKPKESESQLVQYVLNFLSRISHLDQPIPSQYLVTESCVQAIMDYTTERNCQKTLRILKRISHDPSAFQKMLEICFPVMVWSKAADEVNDADSLLAEVKQELYIVAQSEYSQGSIAHILAKGTRQAQQAAALSIPFLYQDHNILRTFLIGLKGLGYVLDCFCSPDVRMVNRAVRSLIHLVTVLDIRAPDNVRPNSSKVECFYPPGDADLTFSLSDGSKLRSNRSLLCRKSKVFTAMLQGSFAECGKEEIAIRDVDGTTFELLLHHLHGCVFDCAAMKDVGTEKCLELLALADRFDLDDLWDFTKPILCHCVTEECAYLPAFEFLCRYGFVSLASRVVTLLLCSDKSRNRLLEDLFKGPHGQLVRDAVTAIVNNHLKCTPSKKRQRTASSCL